MDNNVEMIYSDNPFIDILVYYTKIMALNCVIKNQDIADNKETYESLKNSDLFIACKEGRAKFEFFVNYNGFPAEVLIKSGIPEAMVEECVNDPEKIPMNKRDTVTKNMMVYFVDHYEEMNNYYRMLNGKPDLEDTGLKIDPSLIPQGVVIDTDKYIHEMTTNEAQLLVEFGIIDTVMQEYYDNIPSNVENKAAYKAKVNYLKYIGNNRVDPYEARMASNFGLLYIPNIDSAEIHDKFKEKYELNRQVAIKTVLSEAFKFQSDYYYNFIIIFIVIQTVIDIISEVQEMIIRKDVFDSRTVRYMFECYGIPYYSEIPLKYQIAMVKNMNTLLKYKSTSKNMIDICNLFGFSNITVFKYYLLRDRRMHEDGSFFSYTKTITEDDGTVTIMEDNERNYELKFVKVPIQENADEYIKNKENYIDYDTVTLSDIYWDGDKDHGELKSEIINKQFSYEHSKYISIDNSYSLANMSFDISYFFNILYDNVYLEDLLTVKIPYLSQTGSFKISNVFCFLFAASYLYNGIEDTIMDTPTKVLHIKGFNFKADLAELSAYLAEHRLTAELAGIAGYIIPETSILTFNQLLNIFTTNKKVYEHITKQLYNADNKQIYDIYKKLYDSLMIIDYNNEFFKLPNGSIAKSYTEYLQYNDAVLYLRLVELQNITNKEDQQKEIIDTINNVVYILDTYIDMNDFNAIYSFIPSVSSEYIKQYIIKVINFFKSYKVDLMGISTLFTFDDKFENSIKPIDCVHLTSMFNVNDYYYLADKFKYGISITKSERISILEKLYFDISRWVLLNFKDSPDYNDRFIDLIAEFFCKEILHIKDEVVYAAYIQYKDEVKLVCKKAIYSTLQYTTRYNIHDEIVKDNSYYRKDIVELNDELKELTSNFHTRTDLTGQIEDYFDLRESELNYRESMRPLEKICIEPYMT